MGGLQQCESVFCNIMYFSLMCYVCVSGIPSGTMSGFMRRIFLQVLLEDEKVIVCVEADSHTYKCQHKKCGLQHPRFGTGHRHRTVQTSIHATCSTFIAGAASGE